MRNERLKILVRGPALTMSGYGEQCRFALRSLRKHEDKFDVYLINTGWGHTGWVHEDSEERRWFDSILNKTIGYMQQNGTYDISLQVTIPNEWEQMAPINIGYTAGIETTKVSPEWLQKATIMDKIIVVSNHSKQVFENTSYITDEQNADSLLKCLTSVDVVNYPVRNFEEDELELELENDFNFLVVSQLGPRKNIENTIRWFIEEFKDDEVGLVVKTFLAKNSVIDRDFCERVVGRIAFDYPDKKCSINLLHGFLSDQQMTSLYRNSNIKALVSLTHGEGFGLPMFEAAYNTLPVIAPAWSGHTDFLYMPVTGKNNKVKNKPMFSKVDFDLNHVQKEAVWDGVIQADSMWCFPKEASYKQNLRELYKDYGRFKNRAKKLKNHLVENFTKDKMYDLFANSILGNNMAPEDIDGISFCIPTNGERPDKTNALLKSISRQSGVSKEVILCGDVQKFKDLQDVQLIDKKNDAKNRKVAVLRNVAAAKAKYNVICFCDDDIVLEPDWMQKTLDYSKENGWKVLGNKLLNPDGTRHWDRATLIPHIMVSYSHPNYDKKLIQTSGFMVVRKGVLNEVKWDEQKLVYSDRIERDIPEDVKFSLDLHEKNIPLSFNENVTCWHNDDSYTTMGNQCLKKDILKEKFNMAVFPPGEKKFEILLKELS